MCIGIRIDWQLSEVPFHGFPSDTTWMNYAMGTRLMQAR